MTERDEEQTQIIKFTLPQTSNLIAQPYLSSFCSYPALLHPQFLLTRLIAPHHTSTPANLESRSPYPHNRWAQPFHSRVKFSHHYITTCPLLSRSTCIRRYNSTVRPVRQHIPAKMQFHDCIPCISWRQRSTQSRTMLYVSRGKVVWL